MGNYTKNIWNPGDLITTEKMNNLENITSIIGSEYSSSGTYLRGDYISHEGNLYKCKVASATGNWNSNQWDPTDVAEGLTISLKNRGNLTSNDDILNLRTGIYRKISDTVPINWPESFPDGETHTYGVLICLKNIDDYKVLLYFPGKNRGRKNNNNSIFVRIQGGKDGPWGEWLSIKCGYGDSTFDINESAIGAIFDINKIGGYEIGDYVFYEGKLYKFNYPHGNGAEWYPDDVEETSILKELSALNQRIDELTSGGN